MIRYKNESFAGTGGGVVEVEEGKESEVDDEVEADVEVDGLEMDADMGEGAGVEKNLVLAAERAPLMKESG